MEKTNTSLHCLTRFLYLSKLFVALIATLILYIVNNKKLSNLLRKALLDSLVAACLCNIV